MAKGYHVLAGVCRDLRNALRDASEGSETAAVLIDDVNELLDLLDEGSDGDLPERQEGDDSASGSDAEDEDASVDVVPRETRAIRGVGGGGQGPTLHSTRARGRAERRPSTTRTVRVCGKGER